LPVGHRSDHDVSPNAGSYAISLITRSKVGTGSSDGTVRHLIKPRESAISTDLPHLAFGYDDDQRN